MNMFVISQETGSSFVDPGHHTQPQTRSGAFAEIMVTSLRAEQSLFKTVVHRIAITLEHIVHQTIHNE
jgi:hypothetical protein